jgi:Protein of unknown function (DUF1214)
MRSDQKNHDVVFFGGGQRSPRVGTPSAGAAWPSTATRTLDAPSRFIGRIGALAVALGIGLAIANNPVVALADSTGSESGSDSASGSPASGDSSPSAGGPQSDSDSTPSTTPDSSGGADNSDDDESNGVGDGKTTDTASPPADTEDDLKPRRSGNPTAQSKSGDRTSTSEETTNADRSTFTSSRSTAKASVITTKEAASATAVASRTAQVASSTTLATANSTTDSVTPPITPHNPIATVLTRTVQAITGMSQSANSPVAPPTSPTLWAILGWVRREIQYRLFNAGPTIDYNAIQNVQTFNGVVTGGIRPTDADDDFLTVTVTGDPKKGTVFVAADGSFVYTPTPQLALTGGTDSFQVKVDDRPGNPPHINLFSLLAPDGGATATKTIIVNVTPTSPLGTPEQVAAEKKAFEIMATPQVQAAIAALKTAWLATAQQQFALVGGVDAVNQAQLEQAAREFAYAAALQAQNTNPSNPQITENVLPPHTWYGVDAEGSRVVFDNPDTTYRFIPVSSVSSYVITGRFSGGLPIDTNFTVSQAGQTTANLNGRNLVVNADGTFTITVSSQPAEPGQTNHLQLPTDNPLAGTQLLIRTTVSDYSTETPMSLAIQRVSGPPDTSTPPTTDQLAGRAVALINQGSLSFNQFIRQATVNLATGQLKPPNTFAQPSQSGGQTLATQYQSVGYFQLSDNEAMVITVHPGKAAYFVVPVTNDWAVTYDHTNQQTSLNNAQSVANPDGSYTIVVSPTDPGVANWVSTGVVNLNGQADTVNQGTMFLRFQALDPNSTVNPTISTQVVTLDQLSTVLPPTMKYVTAAERAAALAERKADYDSRFAPYAQI